MGGHTVVSVILPTTGRKEMALAAVQSIRATTEKTPVEIIAVVDADKESAEALRPLVHMVDYSEDYRGNVAAWNRGLELARGDYVVFAADDLEFCPGWLEEALRVMREKFPDGKGMVGFNDGVWDGNQLATHYILHRQFILDVLGGRIAWPCYPHSFNDLETNERAKRAGKYAWAEKAVVRHNHWTTGTRVKDETDNRWLTQYEASKMAYAHRQAAGFPDDYPPVIGLARAQKLRVGWLCDVTAYQGGAELAAAEYLAAAPSDVEIVPISPHADLSTVVDVFVIHNCTLYDARIIPLLETKPIYKVVHDVWPHGDFRLREWLLNHAQRVQFSSKLHLESFPYAMQAPFTFVPPLASAGDFAAKADPYSTKKKGVCWVGRMWPGKGVQNAMRWGAEKGIAIDFYGYGPDAGIIQPPHRLRGQVDYADLPGILSRYETFVFLPDAVEPFSRTTMEAWLAGCKLIVNQNVGALEWLQTPASIDGVFRAQHDFWKHVREVAGVSVPSC